MLRLKALALLALPGSTSTSTQQPSKRFGSVVCPELLRFFETRYPAATKLQPRDGRQFCPPGCRNPAEELFAVARDRIITAGTIQALSDALDAEVNAVHKPRPPPALWLTLWLCYERHRADSDFFPWLSSLPTDFQLPFLWSPAEHQRLSSS